MTNRRPRIRRTEVACPGCGEPRTVQVWPALWVLGRKVRKAAVVLTVSCSRGCGADVPVRGGDIQEAA